MTVSSTANRIAYTGTGAIIPFSFPYYFQSTSDLVVVETVIATGVQTTKAITTDYTVTGTQDANGYFQNGGTVTPVVATPATVTWTIYRNPPATQTVQHVDNDPAPAVSIDGPLDKLTMLFQRALDLVTRSLVQPDGDTTTIGRLPPKVTRANGGAGSYAAYDLNGDPSTLATAAPGSSVPISVAMTPIVQASTLAAARAALGVPALFLPPPQGRLTLTTATPVLTADATAQATIFYTPYTGNSIPISGAVATFSEISAVLDGTNFLLAKNYDLFVYNDSGTIRLGYGPAWTSDTARSAAIALVSGVWVNNASITLRYDSTHTTTVGANTATYVGTTRGTANGQTGMAFSPTAAAGGTNNILGLWNAYNRVGVKAQCRDSSAAYTYSFATWRALATSNSNRISWIDGLQQSAIRATLISVVQGTLGSPGAVGIDIDSITATPVPLSQGGNGSAVVGLTVPLVSPPLLGFHYAQGVEESTSGGQAITFNVGNGPQTLTLELES